MLYKHYKGGLYRVLFEGWYEPSLEEVTIYMSVENGMVWVRPTEVFHELVRVENDEEIPRFREVDERLRQ
ncbi:DUF1653 domain-containing protein [Halobacillus rhizosphaerae]|uniref:DUF1653 domain-containing protein n=1 Tax=Halobacillus rhizosphaerae TaxID=3064889 RepID=UPI00398ABBCC